MVERLGPLRTKSELGDAFLALRADAIDASDRPGLQALFERAGAIVAETRSESWRGRPSIDEYRTLADEEFARTARRLNQRARALGVRPDFAETWEAAGLPSVG